MGVQGELSGWGQAKFLVGGPCPFLTPSLSPVSLVMNLKRDEEQ